MIAPSFAKFPNPRIIPPTAEGAWPKVADVETIAPRKVRIAPRIWKMYTTNMPMLMPLTASALPVAAAIATRDKPIPTQNVASHEALSVASMPSIWALNMPSVGRNSENIIEMTSPNQSDASASAKTRCITCSSTAPTVGSTACAWRASPMRARMVRRARASASSLLI